MLSTALARRSALGVSKQAVRSVSVWSAVPAGPPDPILGAFFVGNRTDILRSVFYFLILTLESNAHVNAIIYRCH